MGRVTVHTGLEEAGIIFTSSGQSSLWAPRRAHPGRCSIGRGWILFTACQPSITEKRLHSRGTFNPDAGFYRGWKRRIICFCAAHSLVDDAHVPSCTLPCCVYRVYHVWPHSRSRTCAHVIWKRLFMENMSNRRWITLSIFFQFFVGNPLVAGNSKVWWMKPEAKSNISQEL